MYDAASAPSDVLLLVNRLVPQMIVGDHPALVVLREQFRRASIARVEMTGRGFYADFDLPPDVQLTEPADFAGGSAEIVLEGTTAGAGCVLFVRDGRLATLEAYTYGDEGWPERLVIRDVKNVQPIAPDGFA